MKQPTWIPAFAAGGLFAGAIALALVVTQPGAGSIALDRIPTEEQLAAPDRPAVLGRTDTNTHPVEPSTTTDPTDPADPADRSGPVSTVSSAAGSEAPNTQPDAAQATAAGAGTSEAMPDTTATPPVEEKSDAAPVSVPALVISGDVDVAQPVEEGCRAKGTEWQRRQDAGEIDWDELGRQTYVDDVDSVWIDPTPYDSSVWAPGQRPTLPDFSSGLDVGTLSSGDLLFAVEVCDEAGMFPEG